MGEKGGVSQMWAIADKGEGVRSFVRSLRAGVQSTLDPSAETI